MIAGDYIHPEPEPRPCREHRSCKIIDRFGHRLHIYVKPKEASE